MFEKVELGVKPKTIYEPDLTFFEQDHDKTKNAGLYETNKIIFKMNMIISFSFLPRFYSSHCW
jgi:hypothetical protein